MLLVLKIKINASVQVFMKGIIVFRKALTELNTGIGGNDAKCGTTKKIYFSCISK